MVGGVIPPAATSPPSAYPALRHHSCMHYIPIIVLLPLSSPFFPLHFRTFELSKEKSTVLFLRLPPTTTPVIWFLLDGASFEGEAGSLPLILPVTTAGGVPSHAYVYVYVCVCVCISPVPASASQRAHTHTAMPWLSNVYHVQLRGKINLQLDPKCTFCRCGVFTAGARFFFCRPIRPTDAFCFTVLCLFLLFFSAPCCVNFMPCSPVTNSPGSRRRGTNSHNDNEVGEPCPHLPITGYHRCAPPEKQMRGDCKPTHPRA